MANFTTQENNIPVKIHNTVIGAGGKLIRSIMSECGGVAIKFPVDDVERTVKLLKELSDEKQLSGISVEVKAKLQHHKFLIGRAGDKVNLKGARDCIDAFIARINEIVKDPEDMVTIDCGIEQTYHRTGARIIFPGANDADRESITIIGKFKFEFETFNFIV